MPRADRQAVDRILADLLDAEHHVRRLREALLASPPEILVDAVIQRVTSARASVDEERRATELVSLATTLGHLNGPQVVDALIDLLGSDEPEPRHAAGSALQELAFERFKEVALGVERALERLRVGDLALCELPYLLAEIPEPGVARLVSRFLEHADPDAVASAIETSVAMGDPSLVRPLSRLTNDTRLVELDDEEQEMGGAGPNVTVGELAQEAIGLLEGYAKGEDG